MKDTEGDHTYIRYNQKRNMSIWPQYTQKHPLPEKKKPAEQHSTQAKMDIL